MFKILSIDGKNEEKELFNDFKNNQNALLIVNEYLKTREQTINNLSNYILFCTKQNWDIFCDSLKKWFLVFCDIKKLYDEPTSNINWDFFLEQVQQINYCMQKYKQSIIDENKIDISTNHVKYNDLIFKLQKYINLDIQEFSEYFLDMHLSTIEKTSNINIISKQKIVNTDFLSESVNDSDIEDKINEVINQINNDNENEIYLNYKNLLLNAILNYLKGMIEYSPYKHDLIANKNIWNIISLFRIYSAVSKYRNKDGPICTDKELLKDIKTIKNDLDETFLKWEDLNKNSNDIINFDINRLMAKIGSMSYKLNIEIIDDFFKWIKIKLKEYTQKNNWFTK